VIVLPETRVRIRKLIRDLRDQYPYGPVPALLIETVANSIDAKATKIQIEIDHSRHIFRIVDDGTGMTREDFTEYHNIAAQTKVRGMGIGFAGVGAKIFLDLAYSVYTETRSADFQGASNWHFEGEVPIWDPVSLEGLVKKSGTGVEVRYRVEDDKEFNEIEFRNAILEHYNYAIAPFGNLRVWLNGDEIRPQKFEGKTLKSASHVAFRCSNNTVTGEFAVMNSALPEHLQGIAIVVKGKTIIRWHFNQVVLHPEMVGGYLRAGYLISAVTTSKTDFNRTTPQWRTFVSPAGKKFSEWLGKVGEKPRVKLSSELDEVRELLEEDLDRLFRMEEIQQLLIDPLQSILKKPTAIADPYGQERGQEVDGLQRTTGTLGGIREGEGVLTAGDEEGVGLALNSAGNEQVSMVRRRLRGGIRLGYANAPDDLHEAWLDLSIPAVMINTGHPAFSASYQMTSESFHIVRCVFDVVTESKDEQARASLRHKLFDGWVKIQAQ